LQFVSDFEECHGGDYSRWACECDTHEQRVR
jgi:hypothetical protein